MRVQLTADEGEFRPLGLGGGSLPAAPGGPCRPWRGGPAVRPKSGTWARERARTAPRWR